MEPKIITIILGSSFLSAIITSIYNKNNNDSNNKLKYITEERRKWRADIRNTVITLITNNDEDEKHKMCCKLQLNLNPNDKEDIALIKCVSEYRACSEAEKGKKEEEILKRAALLLKHDWDRVKLEAGNNSIFPYKVIVVLVLIVSIGIQGVFYKYFKNVDILNNIKTLIDIDLIFYFFTTLVTAIMVLLVLRTLKLILDMECVEDISRVSWMRKQICKVLGIPIREPFSKDDVIGLSDSDKSPEENIIGK